MDRRDEKLAAGFVDLYPRLAFLVRLVRTMPLGIRKTNQERELLRRDGATVAASLNLDSGSTTERSLAFVERSPIRARRRLVRAARIPG